MLATIFESILNDETFQYPARFLNGMENLDGNLGTTFRAVHSDLDGEEIEKKRKEKNG